MKLDLSFMEPLLEKVGHFGQLNIDLIKYKILDKMADLVSSFIARFILLLMFSIFAIFLSIAAALYFGDLLGKSYYGFIVVSGFYGLLAMVILYLQHTIKCRMNNWIISKMLN
jgi:hypothetical protein